MKFSLGCEVPFPEKVVESYELGENYIRANVSLDVAPKLLSHFISFPKYLNQEEPPLFFFLELPVEESREGSLNGGADIKTLHKDVYYLDGIQPDEAFVILERSGRLLFNDGVSSFGFGRLGSNDEFIWEKYNVASIWSMNPAPYEAIFHSLGVPRVKKLVTAWDTFDQDHPGLSRRVEIDGKDIYSLVEEYRPYGLYLAETRED